MSKRFAFCVHCIDASYQEHESDPLSDFERNAISDEDTESLTGCVHINNYTSGDIFHANIMYSMTIIIQQVKQNLFEPLSIFTILKTMVTQKSIRFCIYLRFK